jgi:phage repressor protein C with HTH and peptisase S24 domain
MQFNDVFETLQNLSNIPVRPIDISRALGVSRSNVNYKRDKNVNLSNEDINKIEKYFNISLKDIPNEYIKAIETTQNGAAICSDKKYIKIPYYPDVYLSAGYGVEVFNENYEMVIIDESFLTSERGMKINPKNCKMVKVSGNSMYPEYHHGDRVIIDESDKNLTDGQIYAFRYDNQCYVKEINRAGNTIKCISVNKEYEPFFIERDLDFKVFGRLIPRVRL